MKETSRRGSCSKWWHPFETGWFTASYRWMIHRHEACPPCRCRRRSGSGGGAPDGVPASSPDSWTVTCLGESRSRDLRREGLLSVSLLVIPRPTRSNPQKEQISLFMLTLCNQVLDKARSYTCHSWTELERWRELCALEFSLETQLQVLVHTYWKVTTVKWHVWDFWCENSFKVVKSEYRYYDSITFPVQPVGSSLPIFKFSFIMMIMIMIMTFSIYKDVSPFCWTHFKCFEMPSSIHC